MQYIDLIFSLPEIIKSIIIFICIYFLIKTKKKKNPRDNARYRKWRNQCITRDKRRCKRCGKKAKKLEVHHKKSWATHPRLRYSINNGITLCIPCHKAVDKHRRKFP